MPPAGEEKAMKNVHFVDTTLRDGQLSLWATNMTTRMMLPILDKYDDLGFVGIEVMGAAMFKKMVRELREDPFERLRLISQHIKHTPLRVIRSRYITAFYITPLEISNLWVERLAANGVTEVRASDPSNTPANWARTVQQTKNAGIDCIINVTYSISPKHDNEYYIKKVKAAAKLDVKRICFKDPGGLLTPDRTRELAPIFLKHCGNKKVELHSHTNSGFGPLVALEAVKAGFRVVNTAIPPLANGSSQPSVYSVASNLRSLGYTPTVNTEGVQALTDHFTQVAQRNGFAIGTPNDYDESLLKHQVPGGMVSNLCFQLESVGKVHLLQEVLEETARVRADLGYPIMVTPYSQFVGVQAVMNVLVGERYKQLTDQIIEYALGHWGEEEASGIDPDVKDLLVNRPRAKELARWEPPETTVAELRQTLGGTGVSDDELLLRYFAGENDVAAMRRLGPRDSDAIDTYQPITTLIDELAKRSEIRHFFVQRGDFTVHLKKAAK